MDGSDVLSFNTGKKLFVVGKYREDFNEILDLDLPCKNIYQSVGVKTHIKKEHEEFLHYMDKIPEIILNPDFIGRHPTEPNSIELIKKFDDNIMIAIKLDKDNGYLYVATLFDVKEAKIERRLFNNRLKKFNQSNK